MSDYNLFIFNKGSAVYISSYEDLLNAANNQDEPQRLLFVFAGAEKPGEITPNRRVKESATDDTRKGGALTPLMRLDKLASELGEFADLVEAYVPTELSWDIVFVAGMSEKPDIEVSRKEAEQVLEGMNQLVEEGNIGRFLAFNRKGEIVQLYPPDKTVI